MGARRDRLDTRLSDALVTKGKNTVVKTKERARRDERMTAKLKAGSLPYAPAVMSWLSGKLGKPASRIVQEEVNTLLP